MRTRLMIATATTAALLAGAAFAQSSSAPAASGDTAVNPPASSDQLPAGVATGNAATNPTPSGQAGGNDATNVAPAAGAPAERAPSATAGTDLISNGPVPDTRANRAKYGMPLSNAGRMTKPAGN